MNPTDFPLFNQRQRGLEKREKTYFKNKVKIKKCEKTYILKMRVVQSTYRVPHHLSMSFTVMQIGQK